MASESSQETVIDASNEGATGGEDRADPSNPTPSERSLAEGRSVRSRVPTDRGLEHQQELRRKSLRNAIRRWRHSGDAIGDAVAGCNSIEMLCAHRDSFLKDWEQVAREADILQEIASLDVSMEELEAETRQLRRDINHRIKELNDDARSGTSKGSKSRGSSKRTTSSSTSTKAIKMEAAAKAAELQVKMKYHVAEQELHAATGRVTLQKELDIAQARLQAITEEDTFASLPDTTADVRERVEDYIEGLPTAQGLQTADPSYPYTSIGNMNINTVPPTAPAVSAGGPTPPVTTAVPPQVTNTVQPAHHATLHGHVFPTSAIPRPVLSTHVNSTRHNAGHIWNPHAQQFVPAAVTQPPPGFYGIPQQFVPATVTQPPPGFYDTPQRPLFAASGVPQTADFTQKAARWNSQLQYSRIPVPEPHVFTGDPLDYASWRSAFETLVESKHIPPADRIHYLKRYLGGRARECVEGYFLFTSESSFDEAKTLLDKRFGNKDVIAKAFREKLHSYPKIAAGDFKGLQRFGDFLRQCLAASRAFSCMSSLDDPDQNLSLQEKLPQKNIDQWSEIVGSSVNFPSFERFVQFVEKVADNANHPFIHKPPERNERSNKSIKTPGSSRQHALASSSESQGQPKNDQASQQKKPGTKKSQQGSTGESSSASPEDSTQRDECTFCKKKHAFIVCRQFMNTPIEERRKYVMEHKLCFGCLKPGHMSKGCKDKAICKVCKKPHPTSLHFDRPQDSEDKQNSTDDTELKSAVSHSIGITKGSSTSMILPVYVSKDDDSGNEQLVYAIMDTQSDACFISERTCASLNANGPEVELRLSTLSSRDELISSERISGLQVRGYFSNDRVSLPTTFVRPDIPMEKDHIPTPDTARMWPHLECIADKLVPLQDVDVGLLIGYNCSRLLIPREVIAPRDDGPFAQKTDLGWGIIGETSTPNISSRTCFRTAASHASDFGFTSSATIVPRLEAKEMFTPADLIHIDEDALNPDPDFKYSYNDRMFLTKMKSGITQTEDGHYSMPLPLKDPVPSLPNNKAQAVSRLDLLRRKFQRNAEFHVDYTAFMNEILSKGFAEEAPDTATRSNVWYIPHHGVFHPKKKKIRVVFDCSARYKSISLNDLLLPGPDLTNDLLGVLLRFRKEPTAITCDIQKMFYQFRVHEADRDYLRFLWWPQGDISRPPTTYRMTVHLFGASSSPACSNYGLKQAARDGEAEFGAPAAHFVRSNFYVDDGLASTATPEEAIDLAAKTKALCAKAGIRLHKFATNSEVVLESIPVEDRADGMQSLDIFRGDVTIERALGLEWNIRVDCFQFSVTMKDRPLTRRGLLSAVTSLFDPIGLLSPVVLVGKQILQDICRLQFDWDDALPRSIVVRWEAWRKDLAHLETLKITRCYKPADFETIKEVQLHHFSDASQLGYGQCSYVRMIDIHDRIHCSLVMAKARVAPVRPVTIPRLELSAAVLSVRIAKYVRQQLNYDEVTEFFWTDSDVVLGYISNDARRFHVYVANRVSQIRSYTVPSQWRHVDTATNPADMVSRGCSVTALIKKGYWFSGPAFLYESSLPNTTTDHPIDEEDPEVKRVLNTTTQEAFAGIVPRIERFSDWHKAKRAIANCIKYVRILRDRLQKKTNPSGYTITVADLCSAEVVIVKAAQASAFAKQIKSLAKNKSNSSDRQKQLTKGCSLYKLDPFVDEQGLLRVGGRLDRSTLPDCEKHPIILPKCGHVSQLLVQYHHKGMCHQGRGITINRIRSCGYYIIGCNRIARSVIAKCVVCRRLRSFPQTQKMASLPEDRVEAAEPFSNCAVDLFGPFLVKERRSELKRYGVLFTCLSSRAVHIETANSLSTDSFINALRRMIAIRGPIRQLRCDQGTNFVGAKLEFDRELKRMDRDTVADFLRSNGCDFIDFKFNVPSASHMGGVWERQIRTARSILLVLLEQSSTQLDDESLRTFMYETANIINSRPLTVESLSDPLSAEPLTPNHILTMKSNVVLPPPGQFVREDMFLQKKWRRVQHLLNVFWTRWKKEFLQSLQPRQKWNTPKRNFAVGDIVIIKDDNIPRNQWLMARVEELMPSKDGLIRKVKVRVGNAALNNQGKASKAPTILERPIHKLVLLLEGDQGIPDEEP